MPKRLFGIAEKAFRHGGRMCSGMQERCYGKPGKAFPHNRTDLRTGGMSPYALFIRFQCLRISCFAILFCKDFLLPEPYIHAFRYASRMCHFLITRSMAAAQ